MHLRRDGSLFFFLVIVCFIIILFYQHHYTSGRLPRASVFNPQIQITNKFRSTNNEHYAVRGNSLRGKDSIEDFVSG